MENKNEQKIHTEYKFIKEKIEEFVKKQKGKVVLLSGDFGAGKTTIIKNLEIEKEIQIMDIDWDIHGLIDNMEIIPATGEELETKKWWKIKRKFKKRYWRKKGIKINKTTSEDLEKTIKNNKNIENIWKSILFVAPIAASLVSTTFNYDKLWFFFATLVIFVAWLLFLTARLVKIEQKRKKEKKAKNEKIIVIENLDRTDWDSIRKVMCKIHHLSRLRKKVFIVTYSSDNIALKFKLKYGQINKEMMPTREIEKYIDKEFNTDNFVLAVRKKICKEIFDSQIKKNKSNFQEEHPIAYENIVSLYDETGMTNFRIFQKSVVEMLENIEIINKIEVNPAIIFSLIILKYYDPNFYRKIQIGNVIIYDERNKFVPMTGIKLNEHFFDWDEKSKEISDKIIEKTSEISKKILKFIRSYNIIKCEHEKIEKIKYVNHEIINQNIFFLSNISEEFADYLSGDLEKNFIDKRVVNEYSDALIAKMIRNETEAKNINFLIEFMKLKYYHTSQEHCIEILKRYKELITKDIKIWQSRWIIYLLKKIFIEKSSLTYKIKEKTKPFFNIDYELRQKQVWYVPEIKKVIDSKTNEKELPTELELIFSIAQQTIKEYKVKFDKKLVLKENRDEQSQKQFEQNHLFHSLPYLLTCREKDITDILLDLVELSKNKKISWLLFSFLREKQKFEEFKTKYGKDDINIIFHKNESGHYEEYTKKMSHVDFDKDIKNQHDDLWKTRIETIKIIEKK